MPINLLIKCLLAKIVSDSPKGYHITLKSHKFKFIIDYLNRKFPQLQNKKYTLGTKVYWLLHDITDFPKCTRKECQNKLYKNVIVTTGYAAGYCSIYCEVHDEQHKQKVAKSCQDRFGVDSYSKTQEFKDMMTYKAITRSQQEKDKISKKRENTCLDMYGVRNVFCKGEIRNKFEYEREKKHGSRTWNNPNKAIETRKQHNINDPNFQANINKKTNETRKLHRQLYPNYDKNIIEKRKQTIKQKRIADPNYDQKIYDKHVNTYYQKTGYYWPSQNPKVRHKMRKKYTYCNVMFDSAPEIAYYIWLLDHNIDFEYHPSIRLQYYANNKIHFYEPDFLIKSTNQLEDIKGDQFLKLTFIQRGRERLECIKQNNVRLIYSDEYNIYMNYCSQKFSNKLWYLKFKNF